MATGVLAAEGLAAAGAGVAGVGVAGGWDSALVVVVVVVADGSIGDASSTLKQINEFNIYIKIILDGNN